VGAVAQETRADLRDETGASTGAPPGAGGGIPAWLVRYGGAAWRLLAIGAVVFFGFQVLRRVSVVALAVTLALFPASVLWRPVRWLDHRGWRPGLATGAVMLTAIGALAGVGAVVVPSVGSQIGDLTADVGEAATEVRAWLTEGPLGLSERQVQRYWESIGESFTDDGTLTSGLLGGASAAIEVVTGLILVIVVTFFLLKDGERIFAALLRRVPDHRRDEVDRGASAGWHALSRYMSGLALVGLFDAVLIGLGLLVVGVPLVVPLSIIVFFGAFFPVIGAFVTGLIAVAVAFANGGLVDGLIILAIITAVQQIEGDVVLPLIFGKTLEMHPLVILLAVVAGGVAFGVVGAFLFVPAVAVALTVRQELAGDPAGSYWSLARGVGSLEEETEAPHDEEGTC
jgi:putative heme transporter